MESNDNKSGRLVRVDFECNSVPLLHKSTDKRWVDWGHNNSYPNFLLTLKKRNAYHGAILDYKAEYVYGKGLAFEDDNLTVFEQAQYHEFLSRANDTEDWNDIFRKNTMPLEWIDGIALEVVWKLNGKCDVFSLNPGLFRSSPDGKKYFYCEAWHDENGMPTAYPEKHPSFRTFDKFNPERKRGSQILYYKIPKLNLVEFGNVYPEPNYTSIIQDIETDIEITNFHYSNLKNGMSASAIISLFNGEPEPAEQKKIAKLFKNNHTGSNNAGKFILNFVDKGGEPADITTLTSSDLDKQFELLGKRLLQNIFTGHKFDPILGGIKTEGELGGAKEVLEKFDKFLKTYVEYRQAIHINIIRLIGEAQGIELNELYVQQMTPIKDELPSDPNIHALFDVETLKNYYAEKYGLITEDSEVSVQEMESLPANDNIKNLKGAEYRRLQSLIAKYKAGKIGYEEAQHLILGYGLGQDYVNIVLGQKFSKDKNSVLELFEMYAEDDNDDAVVAEYFVHDSESALKAETLGKQKFASDSVNAQVLEILKGNPLTTPDAIAKQLGIDVNTVNEIIGVLQTAGSIAIINGILNITDKGLTSKPAEVEYETYTVYKYATRTDVPRAKQSRDFCQSLLTLSNNGRRWTREGIDKIKASASEKLSMPDFDPWVYRGGFYNNPSTQTIEPYCRHIWKAITKTRKKK